MGEKDYSRWMPVKAGVNNAGRHASFKERDVFWTSIGENVGFEEDGKGPMFRRPVLVVKKFNDWLFWGVPLSTTRNRGRHYHEVTVKGRPSVALLSQAGVWDSARLANKTGMVGQEEFDALKRKLAELLLGQSC
ncbi:MAG: type II toxin-antitoxin system PemK/MazF family toxin [Coriobacteriales bacterium]|jgi:mRNA interferase MazF|nr:type II toxin-antitoxin system PemK/MazF family toxin [Coriobacteriales bacterium]